MRNLINSAAATAMCAMIAASVAPTQAAAGVVGMGDQAKIGAASPVQQFTTDHYCTGIIITIIGIMCHWRHHYYRHYYGYYPYYYNPWGGVGRNGGGRGDLPVLGLGISLIIGDLRRW